METQIVVIDLAPEVTALLADNGLELITELRKQELDVKRTPRPDELEVQEPVAKSVELIILASAAAAPLVASAITRIIDAISRSKKGSVTSVPPKTKSSGSKTAGSKTSSATESSSHSTKLSFLGLKV